MMGEDWWRFGTFWPETTEQGEARLASGEEFQRHRQDQARRDEWWENMEVLQGYWRYRFETFAGFHSRVHLTPTEREKQRIERNKKQRERTREKIKRETPEEREARLKKGRERSAARRKWIRETETAEEREARLKKHRELLAARRKSAKEAISAKRTAL